MATSREVYSEDDNFIIGDDLTTDRFRREARQLHLSEFSRIRREAHFTRYRNSFLKCDLDQTNDRIEQGRKLRLSEMERVRAAALKQEENRRKNRHDIPLQSPTNGKLIRKDATGERTGSGSWVAKEVGKRDSSLGVASSSSSRASPVSGRRHSEEKHELTNATIPSLIISPKSMSDDERCSVESHQNSRNVLPAKVAANCRENDIPAEGRKQLNKRLSVGTLSVAGKHDLPRNRDKRLSAATASRMSQALSVAGKHDLARNRDERLSATVSILSRAPSAAGNEDLAGKRAKRFTSTASRLSRAPTVTENRDSAGKLVSTTVKTPSLHVTSPEIDRKSSFESNAVVIEKAGQREKQIEERAKSTRNSNLNNNRVEKEEEADPGNGLGEGIRESKKRTHSASVSESDSESSLSSRSSRASHVNRKSVSPNSQVSHEKKAQTQSAHERWMWEEFDKIMKDFADILRIEYKSVNFKNKKKAVEKDTKLMKPPPQNVPPSHSFNNPMTSLYFRFGISDRIVFRC